MSDFYESVEIPLYEIGIRFEKRLQAAFDNLAMPDCIKFSASARRATLSETDEVVELLILSLRVQLSTNILTQEPATYRVMQTVPDPRRIADYAIANKMYELSQLLYRGVSSLGGFPPELEAYYKDKGG